MQFWDGNVMEKRNFGRLVCAAVFMFASQISVEAASPSTELKKVFSKMDRQLCKSLSLATCKRANSQKKGKPKPNKTRDAAASKSRKGKTVKSQPVQASKESSGNMAPVVLSPEKSRIPIPTLKPATLTAVATTIVPRPVEKKPPPQKLPDAQVAVLPVPVVVPLQPAPPSVHAMPDGTLTGEACLNSLAELGVKFTMPTTNVGTGVCSVVDAVQVQALTIGNATIKLSDQPTFNCGFAFVFASWLKVEAIPIVTKATGKTIATFGTGPGYQCRGRNGDMSAKLSEHAFGNAVDIERMKLSDGEVIDVKDAITNGAKYEPALAALRASACRYFTTVLGPGTNAAHATHFHFDLARRGKNGNHKMCQ